MDSLRSAPALDPERFLDARYGLSRRQQGQFRPVSAGSGSAIDVVAPSLPGVALEPAATGGTPSFAVRALNRLTFGQRSSDLSLFKALGSSDSERLANWVDWQLAWDEIDDSALQAKLDTAGYVTLDKSRSALWTEHLRSSDYNTRMRPGWEVQRAKFVRATFSERQLLEVMTDFWHDHFNVYGSSYDYAPMFPRYDRIMRKYALGNFKQMLESVATSNAMLYYLDNVYNSRSGPNENWARELLELHTLGSANYYGFMNPFEVPPDADDPSFPAGYTDIDVYETASAFTGWTVKNGHWQYPAEDDGNFVYRAAWHDTGPKFVLGMLLNPEQPAMADGRQIISRLAQHPATARSICRKLISRLVGGAAPGSLVTSAARVFRANVSSSTQLAKVVRHIVLSTHFRNTWSESVRRPFESVVAAMRAISPGFTIRLDHARSNDLMWRMGFTGNVPFAWPAPDGCPDEKEAWLGSNSLAMSWKLLNWMTEAADGSTALLPIVQISRSKVAKWTAPALVDYWSKRLLGFTLTSSRRSALIQFMAQNGSSSYVIEDTDAWSGNDLKRHYNHQRLKSMVSLIMMSVDFIRR
ncbi:DUF1800 domain-containing protein [Coralloluteibacterium stylophorae]|uniref:DUF1800 domain-containing protein n=1 Tax=Coralloluteibacterium stylophorae TaxID=1776034 RepID=A0AAP2CAY4_9GAMM|nr:DUF1800 domain-containing protein [Coralloluteibacterium stylophorae]MBS7457069.1 DUF1800 domain-containing protein [Coralloluteibacterium stylophorae]